MAIQNPGGAELPTDYDGQLSAYAFPGGYGIVYSTITGDILCPDCARQEIDQIQNAFLHQEGPSLFCDECGKELESDYGDPDEC